MMRRITSIFIFILLLFLMISGIPTSHASEKNLVIGGNTVRYRGTNINVTIPNEYVKPDTDFRGVWVTPIVGGNLARFSDVYQYKQEITQVLDIMEYYNLNALIFHVRPFNDALYNSELNPWSRYLVGFGVDPGWDPLPWIIEETHKRGIEFHAWLNPYRITNSGATNPGNVAVSYRNYPQNPASNPEYILVNTSADSQRAILNPGEPVVRDFLVDTVLEIMENYDVDGIHFDDYFYINGINDDHTRSKPGYNPNNLGVSDWRRQQVDLFIKQLSDAMRNFNLENDRYVQLGISPTGIYKNGGSGFAYGGADNYDSNGNFVTNGSNTAGQEHYQSYLFSNTKKWVDNEWIDYIIPQTYWAFTHTVAAYADIVDWWAKVVRYKNVNLYTGMGIYMSSSGGNYSWGFNEDEASMQVLYNTKHEQVQGTSIFSYSELKYSYLDSIDSEERNKLRVQNGLEKLRTNYWNTPSIMPELRTYDPVYLNKVINLQAYKADGSVSVSFNKIDGASKYAIYRSNTTTFTNEDLVAVIGHDSEELRVTYADYDVTLDNYYQVVPISRTNTLGEPAVVMASTYSRNELGEITNPQLMDVRYPGYPFSVVFDKIPGIEGVNYHLEFSYDLISWETISTQLVDLETQLGADIKLPYNDGRYFIKIVASNDDGQSIVVLEVPFDTPPLLEPINRVSVRGTIKSGQNVELFWTAISDEFYQDLEYYLEYSHDNVNFTRAKVDYYINDRNRVLYNVYIPNQPRFMVRVIMVHPFTGKEVIGQVVELTVTNSTYFEYLEIVVKKHINKISDILS